MARPRFPMFHAHGGQSETTQEAYDAVWFAKGWRKSRPKTSSSSAEETNTQADDTAQSEGV